MAMRVSVKVMFMMSMVFLPGCGTLYLDAPKGSNVRLLPKKARVDVRVQKTVWFKWWGKEPVKAADAHAATIIRQQRLVEARIRMTNTLVDGVVSAITGIAGFPRRTLIVEGNRRPGPARAQSTIPMRQQSSGGPLPSTRVSLAPDGTKEE